MQTVSCFTASPHAAPLHCWEQNIHLTVACSMFGREELTEDMLLLLLITHSVYFLTKSEMKLLTSLCMHMRMRYAFLYDVS